jgi:hypothetical protein
MGLVTASAIASSVLLKHPEQWGRPAIGFCVILAMHIAVAISAHRNGQRLLAAMRHAPELTRTSEARPIQIVVIEQTAARKSGGHWSLGLRANDALPDTPSIHHRIIAPLKPPQISVPALAEYFEDGDTRVVRLVDGTMLLIDEPQGEALPDNVWLAPPPRPIPWLVRAQLLTMHGGTITLLSMAAYIWVIVIMSLLPEWPFTHLTSDAWCGFGGILVLCFGLHWATITAIMTGYKLYRRLHESAFGKAFVLEMHPLGRSHPHLAEKCNLRLCIRDEDGVEYEQRFNTWVYRNWPLGVEIPVLFDPQQRYEPILLTPLSDKGYGFFRINATGHLAINYQAAINFVLTLAFTGYIIYAILCIIQGRNI